MSDVWLAEDEALRRSYGQAPEQEPGAALGDGSSERLGEEGLHFSGVRALRPEEPSADDSDRPADTTMELKLNGESGVLLSAGGSVVWSAPWSGITRCSTPERLSLIDGRRGVLLSVFRKEGTPLLVVVPARRPGKAESSIRSYASKHGVGGRRSSLAPALAMAAVVLVAAAVAACLLAAGHSFHL
jgi:hypothetical protein